MPKHVIEFDIPQTALPVSGLPIMAITVRQKLQEAILENSHEAGRWLRQYVRTVTVPEPKEEEEGEFSLTEALEIAIEALEARAAETDTASPEGHRVRGAIDAIRSSRYYDPELLRS